MKKFQAFLDKQRYLRYNGDLSLFEVEVRMHRYLVVVVLLFCGINNLWAMDGAGSEAEPYLI